MYLLHNDKQKWYYLSRQTPDDVLLIKIYDSSQDVKAISEPYRHHSSTSIGSIRQSQIVRIPPSSTAKSHQMLSHVKASKSERLYFLLREIRD